MDGRATIPDGAVAFARGKIIAVGRAADLIHDFGSTHLQDLGDAILLPGLVNAHTHLELSHYSCGESPGGSFADWIMNLRSRQGGEAEIVAGVRAGAAQCIRFGVTCAGDISQLMHLTRPILKNGPLRVVSFGEALGLAKLRPRFDELLGKAIDQSHESEFLRTGLSPHAPYTVDYNGYRQCAYVASELGLPIATHLAETPQEAEFLASHSGTFRQIWDKLGLWSDDVPTFAQGPIFFAASTNLLDQAPLLAHVNYCNDAELAELAKSRASVVYCPRTHRYFGHPPHRWREMLDAGINVAVGTDSCASSPDLNLVDELRLLRKIGPDVPATTLWEMATMRAARAIEMDDRVGSLAPGKLADFVASPVSGDDPLEQLLHNRALPSRVWIGGKPLSAPSAASREKL
jgi:cytosine/adenosine deaminase-related metal-dependent hydrolase